METTAKEERQESKLVRNLGFRDLMGIAIGQIIGAGIMTMTGIAIGMTGTGVVLAFVVSPILSLISMIPIVLMSSAVPTTGGAYRYTSRLLGKKAGFVYLILFLISNCTIALYALGFGSYWSSVLPGDERVVASIMLIIFFVINLLGAKSAAIFNTIISVVMVGGILLFIALGMPEVHFDYLFQAKNLFTHGTTGFLTSLALLSFATGGAQVVAEMGGEVKNAKKTIPRVIVISTVIVGILYALMACVAAGVLPIPQVANQPLTLVADAVMPKVLFYLFIFGSAMGATASTLNATLSWVSKSFLVACEDGLLPKSLATVSKRGVPYKILSLFFIVGMLPIVTGLDISFVSKLGTTAVITTKILLCAALAKIVAKYPQQMKNGLVNISSTTAKVVAVITAIISIALASIMLVSLPNWAIFGFVGIMAVVIIYSNFGLKHVDIPDDLAVDYTTKGLD